MNWVDCHHIRRASAGTRRRWPWCSTQATPLNRRDGPFKKTALFYAVDEGNTACVELLVARDEAALDVDASMPLVDAALYSSKVPIVKCLLEAGADPTVIKRTGRAAVDTRNPATSRLIKAAIMEPERARVLFQARFLLDTARGVDKAFADAHKKGQGRAAHQQTVLKAAPAYLKGRVERGEELPQPVVGGGAEGREPDPAGLASVRYVLGLEGACEGSTGLPPELFVEPIEFLVPRWDPARKDEPLGAYYERVKRLES